VGVSGASSSSPSSFPSSCSCTCTSSLRAAYEERPGGVDIGLARFLGDCDLDFAALLFNALPGVSPKPPFSACSTYRAYVAISGEPRTCSLFGRGRATLGLNASFALPGGEGVTARMVECAVEGRTGEDGVGVVWGRGRKCVDIVLLFVCRVVVLRCRLRMNSGRDMILEIWRSGPTSTWQRKAKIWMELGESDDAA